MRFLLLFLFALTAPLAINASTASIITRPGVATSPIKYYFDLNSSLEESVNHRVKVAVTASNSERTAVRFDSVQLFTASGALLGRNVATETDALTATPYTFRFENFGVAGDDLKTVAGVQITFFDAGGDNPTGKVTVSGVVVSVDRSVGEECIAEDPLLVVIPEKPVATIRAMQMSRQIARVGGDSSTQGGGGGGCAGGSSPWGPCSGASFVNDGDTFSTNQPWSNPSNAATGNGSYASATLNSQSDLLRATNFGFSIPETATITGITAEVKRFSGSDAVRDNHIFLIKGGALSATDASAGDLWLGIPTYAVYDANGSLWGETWTPADINSSSFGVAIGAVPDTLSQSGAIDHIRITVTYTDEEGDEITAYPTTGESTPYGFGVPSMPWISPGNITADDDALAQSTAPIGTTLPTQADYLDVGGFTDFFDLPSSATLNGIIIEVDRSSSPESEITDNLITLSSNGSSIGVMAPGEHFWPTNGEVFSYGSDTDISVWGVWAGPLNIDSIKDPSFTIRFFTYLSLENGASVQDVIAKIDFIRVTAYYTPLGGSIYDAFIDLIQLILKWLALK